MHPLTNMFSATRRYCTPSGDTLGRSTARMTRGTNASMKAPTIAPECWSRLGRATSILSSSSDYRSPRRCQSLAENTLTDLFLKRAKSILSCNSYHNYSNLTPASVLDTAMHCISLRFSPMKTYVTAPTIRPSKSGGIMLGNDLVIRRTMVQACQR